jgi:UDP-N-acetyl-2-amino-2-deoxyglucuronate dehydrogenase
MKKFALIGTAGFIAPRHLKAIRDTGNTLTAGLDPFDSVGILDSFFPETDFFTEFERFDRHLEKLRRDGSGIDYLSICSPNYLHDSHIRLGLRLGSNVICEKPIVLNPWNIDALKDIENETGQKIFNVLQLRLHPSIIGLRDRIQSGSSEKVYDVDLAYITSRGRWYHYSWKGDEAKSGGIATNIGVHFFDALSWIFGPVKDSRVHVLDESIAAGYLEMSRARVRWFLSVDGTTLPKEIREKGQRTYRSLKIEGEEFEFSDGFTDLHTQVYQNVLQGNGFTLDDAKGSIETVYDIRSMSPIGIKGDYHPLLAEQKKIISIDSHRSKTKGSIASSSL